MRRLLIAFVLVCSSAHADFSVTLDAGRLRVSSTTPLPHVDNIFPFSNGSVLLLIAANGDGTFSSTLSPGSFVAGNDIILAAGGFNNSGGSDETVTLFVPTGGLSLPANDRIALRWFPDITYAQYLSGTKPSGGQHFGTYNPRTSVPPNVTDNPDGGDPWTVPLSGTIALNFFTTDSGGGGTQQPSEGYASSIVSGIPTPTPTPTESGEALLNISTRARAETGENVLIGGFILGNGSSPKTVVVRAIGPSLSPLVTEALTDPSLQLFNSSGQMIASNNDWMTDPNQQALIDSGLAPTDSRESAILTSLVPGAYTAIVTGLEGTQNIALVEVYDLDSINTPQLLNISTRGFVETGDGVMIAGVIVGGTIPKAVVVRGLGPSLATSIANPLPNPTLTLYNCFGQIIGTNDNWQDDPNSQGVIDANLAPTNSLESAILTALTPGSYTAILSDANGATGVGLVEIYNITPAQ